MHSIRRDIEGAASSRMHRGTLVSDSCPESTAGGSESESDSSYNK